MPPKMTDRVELLEAKVAALQDFVKFSLVEFRQALLVEMGKALDRRGKNIIAEVVTEMVLLWVEADHTI